jgi:hypothetical protein
LSVSSLRLFSKSSCCFNLSSCAFWSRSFIFLSCSIFALTSSTAYLSFIACLADAVKFSCLRSFALATFKRSKSLLYLMSASARSSLAFSSNCLRLSSAKSCARFLYSFCSFPAPLLLLPLLLLHLPFSFSHPVVLQIYCIQW